LPRRAALVAFAVVISCTPAMRQRGGCHAVAGDRRAPRVAAPDANAPSPGRTTLVGTVADSVTGRAVQGVNLVLITSDSLSIPNDSVGGFLFADVAPGRHVVLVRRIGYLPRRIEVNLEANQVTRVQWRAQAEVCY
jgi:hypothetical protein